MGFLGNFGCIQGDTKTVVNRSIFPVLPTINHQVWAGFGWYRGKAKVKSISKILGFLLLAPLFAGSAAGAKFDYANSSCDQITAHTLRDLNKLRMENEQVSKACQQSHGIPANNDHSYRHINGDCALTYSAIRYYIKGVEKEVDRSCGLTKQAKALAAACQQSGQADCQKKTGAKFKEAGDASRSAVNLLKRAQDRLIERMEWNEETAYEYAKYLNLAAEALQRNQPLPDATEVFGMSPDQVLANAGLPRDPQRLRQAASTITGKFREGDSTLQLDPYSKEQHNAFLQGKNFVKESSELQGKMQRFNAYLNKNANLQLDRGNQLGAGPSSSITGGNSPSLLGAAGAGAALGQMAGAQNQASGSAAANYPNAAQAGSQAASLPPDPNDSELERTLAGKPLSAKELERREGPEEEAILAEDAQKGDAFAGGDLGQFAALSASGAGSEDSSSLGSEAGSSTPRGLASIQANSKGGLGGLNSSGASSPMTGSAASKKDGTKSGDEAFENYTEASGSGVKKPLDRSGPSLRDLLRQKMNGGGASTRVMHDVLGDMQEQVDEGMQRIDSMSGEEEEYAGSEDIKGMDSEPLFVRIRAAHLRYQQVQVSAASY